MNFEQGVLKYKEGDFEAALAIFTTLILKELENPMLYLYRGRTLTRLGKGIEALADFDRLVELEPYNTDYISDRGVVLHLLGKNDAALEELDRAANLDPKNPYRYSSRAYLKDRMGDLLGAIADYEKAIELDPEDAVAYNNLGLVEEKLGRKEKANAYFTKADDLSAYPPKKETILQTSPTEFKHPPTSANPVKKVSKPQKMTVAYFFSTLKALVTKPEIRMEFSSFLKAVFDKKRI